MIDFCPYCGKEHDVRLVEEEVEVIIKDDKIKFIEKNYWCDVHNEGYYNSKMFDENLTRCRDAYRIKHNLLTSTEIKEIREMYGLSQADFSLILGFGEVTITRYETKEIQNENYDAILREVKDNPFRLYDYFLLNKKSFSPQKQVKICKKIFKLAPSVDQMNQLIENNLVKKHFSIDELNKGKRDIKLNRILCVIKEILKSDIKLYKTKLAKLLWYIDMVNYKNNKESITGLAYYHMTYGACPLGLNLILDSKSIVVDEIEDDEAIKYLIKSVDIDYNLSNHELNSINEVMNKFKDYSTREIVEYMHKEKAYIETLNNEFISFEYAKYIKL